MKSIVTVVIPVGPLHVDIAFNAVRSAQRQTAKDAIKALVINDSGQRLDLSRIDNTPLPIDVLETPGRTGASAARNLALDRVDTPFVVFLDSDDALTNTGVEMLLKGYAYFSAAYIYGDDFVMAGGEAKPRYNRSLDYDRVLVRHRSLHTISALLNTEQARRIRFDEAAPGWEDGDFFIRMCLAGYCGQHINTPIITYRLHTGERRRKNIVEGVYTPMIKKYEGIEAMGCCGPDAPLQELALNAMSQLKSVDRKGYILMDYIGPNKGPILFKQVNGHLLIRQYYGADDSQNKQVWADARDVELLEWTGKWQRAPMPSEPTTPFEFETLSIEPNGKETVKAVAPLAIEPIEPEPAVIEPRGNKRERSKRHSSREGQA